MKKIICTSIFFLLIFSIQAQQNLWKKTGYTINELPEKYKNLDSFETFELKAQELKDKLMFLGKSNKENKVLVNIPFENGRSILFEVRELSNFSKTLQDQYPSIRSYRGFSVNNPEQSISISISADGVNIHLFSNEENFVIEPMYEENNTYIKYNVDNLRLNDKIECFTESKQLQSIENNRIQDIDDGIYRTYRLAVSTDGEFGSYFGGLQQSLVGINNLLTIVNSIYERDLSVHLELVADNDQLIYLNANTDPYWFNSQSNNNLNAATQQTIDNTIGSANYDVGILFSAAAGGGNAGDIGSVCNDNTKGSAYAGSSQAGAPEGYFYAMTIAHEIGHQFGANHTFSRTEYTGTNMEPGSGTTIMGYSGYTSVADVQPLPDDEFHAVSIFQISNFIKSGNICGSETLIMNSAPVISNLQDYSIPTGTPFKLTGSATDIDNDKLTYSWEQVDSNDPWNGGGSSNFEYPSSASTVLPSFRVYPPTTDPVQYFPPFEEVLKGSLFSTWNMLPLVGRELNFAFQVRDNSPLGGQTMADQMTVYVEDQTGPFQITSIQENETLQGGISHALTWDVNGTDSGNIGVTNVKISSSFDGGETFNVLVASTPNDGQENITLPVGEVDEAYIMVEAIDNIFYAVSPVFSIDVSVSVDCLTIENSMLASLDLPTTFNQQMNFPIEVTQSGIIDNINLSVEFSNVASENLLIGLLSPSGEGSYFYLGHCEGKNDMRFTFDQEGSSLVDNCGNLTDQHVEPPVGSLEEFYGDQMNGTWFLVVSYAQLQQNSTNTGGELVSAELEFCSRNTQSLSVEKLNATELEIFPNPARETVYLQYSQPLSGEVQLELYGLSGKKVIQNTYASFDEISRQGVSVANLASGIYLLKFKQNENEIIKKLIIQ